MGEKKIEIEKGCGNVFKDLGLPNPEERLAKTRLVFIIDNIITERRLRLRKAAKILGISKSELSTLLKGRLVDFSVDYLLLLLRKLDPDVEIVLHKKPGDVSVINISVSTTP